LGVFEEVDGALEGLDLDGCVGAVEDLTTRAWARRTPASTEGTLMARSR